MKANYAYIWEFIVPADSTSAFEKTYGPEGDWVNLFRQFNGYVHTDLYRDASNKGRYLTIDYWESKEAWEVFRRDGAARYKELDEQCEALTENETFLGEFEPRRS